MTTALVPASESRALEQRNSMLPAMTIAEAVERFNAMVEFTQSIMTRGKDFGEIPGTDKPTLLKPGAEKLSTFFGLAPRFEIVEKTQDWTGSEHNGEPFFYYMVKCRLFRGERFMGEGDGSCNSWESRYRYRWVSEHEIPAGIDKSKCRSRGGKISEFDFSVNKAETTGKYGKPASYWQRFKDAIANGTAKKVRKKTKGDKEFDAWEIDQTLFRVPNGDIADAVNTVLKIACKRALIAAVLITTNASEYYTQDLDDLEVIDVEFTETTHHAPPQPSAQAAPTANGNGHHGNKTVLSGADLEKKVREIAKVWQKEGYCDAQAVWLKVHEWARGQGCDKEIKDWPEQLRASVGDYMRSKLLPELKQAAPEAQLKTIDELCGRLGLDTDAREEWLAKNNLLQPGEVPNEHRAQSIILALQQQLRNPESIKPEQPSAGGDDEGDNIPF